MMNNSCSRSLIRLSAAVSRASKANRAYTSQSKSRKPGSDDATNKSTASKVAIKGHSLLQGVRLRRSFLYVPAHKERFIQKALTSAADCIVLDLEDGVAPSEKQAARENIKQLIGRLSKEGYRVGENQKAELCLRVNHEGWLGSKPWEHMQGDIKSFAAPSEELNQDLSLLTLPEIVKLPITIVIPKTNSPYDLRNLGSYLMQKRTELWGSDGHHIRRPQMIPTIETAHGIMNLPVFSTHAKFYSAMVFAAEDYCASIGIPRTADHLNMLFARSNIVNLCKMTHATPIDMVCQDFKNLEILKQECEEGVNLGFEGKQAIHPDQIETINKIFSPSSEEIEWAKGLLEAVEKNKTDGAFEFEGKMVDRPVFRKAENILEKHRLIEEFERKKFVTIIKF